MVMLLVPTTRSYRSCRAQVIVLDCLKSLCRSVTEKIMHIRNGKIESSLSQNTCWKVFGLALFSADIERKQAHTKEHEYEASTCSCYRSSSNDCKSTGIVSFLCILLDSTVITTWSIYTRHLSVTELKSIMVFLSDYVVIVASCSKPCCNLKNFEWSPCSALFSSCNR